MRKLLLDAPLSALQALYEARWGRHADSLFHKLKEDLHCATVADVARVRGEDFLHTRQLGGKAYVRLMVLLDENGIKHTLKEGRSERFVQGALQRVLLGQNNIQR